MEAPFLVQLRHAFAAVTPCAGMTVPFVNRIAFFRAAWTRERRRHEAPPGGTVNAPIGLFDIPFVKRDKDLVPYLIAPDSVEEYDVVHPPEVFRSLACIVVRSVTAPLDFVPVISASENSIQSQP